MVAGWPCSTRRARTLGQPLSFDCSTDVGRRALRRDRSADRSARAPLSVVTNPRCYPPESLLISDRRRRRGIGFLAETRTARRPAVYTVRVMTSACTDRSRAGRTSHHRAPENVLDVRATLHLAHENLSSTAATSCLKKRPNFGLL